MRQTKASILLLLLVALILSACGGSSHTPRTLTVYAAASLTDAFTELGKAFEAKHSGVRVVFNFGGSQNLRTQIEQGAPADVFASANTREMNTLVTQRFVDANLPKVFLTNQLVVILPKREPCGHFFLERSQANRC